VFLHVKKRLFQTPDTNVSDYAMCSKPVLATTKENVFASTFQHAGNELASQDLVAEFIYDVWSRTFRSDRKPASREKTVAVAFDHATPVTLDGWCRVH
jgi:hypothetical protein